jgi:biopolymer transport protein ExbB/TolQ
MGSMFALLQASGATDTATNAAVTVANATDAVANAAAAAPEAISAAEQAAATAEAAKAAGQAHTSLWDMVSDATIVSKIVLAILVLCAIYALSLLFEKVLVMRAAKSKISNFMASFKKAKTPDEAASLVAKQPDSTIKKMFTAGWAEVQKTRDMGLYNMKTGDHTLSRVQTAMDLEQNKGVEDLGSNMTFLASIGANAPFIGLFGTVFGIMNSFIGIANSQTTSLAVVAPGIAEALLATAAGLLAAIPAVLIYNFSSKAIGQVGGYMDDFKAEFLSLLSRDMDSKN